MPTHILPRDARLISLLLSSNPLISDAQPQVLHQLLEFAHRYTQQVLSDSLVYAEHAGRPGGIQIEDVTLAIQARAGWEFGGRVPKEYLQSLADKTNSIPLPSIPETYGVRLPPSKHQLTAVDFDLVPNRPPPGSDYYYDETEAMNGLESDLHGDSWETREEDMEAVGEDDVMANQGPGEGAEAENGGLFGEGDEDGGDDMDEDQEDIGEDDPNDPLAGLQPLSNGFGGMVSMGAEGPGDDASAYGQGARKGFVEDDNYDF